jgi:mannosyl-3-phosphoglycerate phosphatase family protein
MQGYQEMMDIEEFPFIVENGSAVYTTNSYFDYDLVGKTEKYDCYKLGKNYSEIVKFLESTSAKFDHKILGFHNTDKNEIIKRTQLSEEAVVLAMQREYSVPVFYDEYSKEILSEEVKTNNLKILFGGRFMHILGNTDKGKALNFVKQGFIEKFNMNKLKSIAIGDTLNDEAMLKEADIKILVKRYNDEYDQRVQIDNLIYSPYIGPKGWNHSILKILGSGE